MNNINRRRNFRSRSQKSNFRRRASINSNSSNSLNGNGNLILSSSNLPYKRIEDRAIKMVLNDDRPLKIINAPANISAAIMRLQSFDDRFSAHFGTSSIQNNARIIPKSRAQF